jgi:hypothetical protein
MTQRGWRSCNLRTQFERLIKRAGLKPWPRLFHNLRSSRETELAAEYPIQVVTAWLGNTPRIALKHYLQVTDAGRRRPFREFSYDRRKHTKGRCKKRCSEFKNDAKSSAADRGTPSQRLATKKHNPFGAMGLCVALRLDAK